MQFLVKILPGDDITERQQMAFTFLFDLVGGRDLGSEIFAAY